MKQREGEKEGGEGARGLGVRTFISVRCYKIRGRQSCQDHLRKGLAQHVEMQATGFLFHCILDYRITSLLFYLLVIDNEAVKQDTHRKKEEAQFCFYREFRSHLGQHASIVFIIALMIMISIQCSLLEGLSITPWSSETLEN